MEERKYFIILLFTYNFSFLDFYAGPIKWKKREGRKEGKEGKKGRKNIKWEQEGNKKERRKEEERKKKERRRT